ncbi:MAG: c-type cytochrome [Thermoguttaceae bacterium]|jgi:cytochrome c oxidase cbb3-type subunit 3|nr:c-type cytochrome [Thermoguttaceae bacterium]
MNKNKHLLLWSSLGTLVLLAMAAVQENYLKDWRAIQASMHTEAGPTEVRLRQIVAPRLRVTDRCVTCHVGMAPGEQGATGHVLAAAHPPVVHDPAEFGCTVCHGGQGRATEKADAHGDVRFWPTPMIPTRYAHAGCGSCHTHVQVPNRTVLNLGRNLFERHDCLACHRLDGRGGTLRPGRAGGMEGPDLSNAGARGFDQGWYAKHLRRARQRDDIAWKAGFAALDAPDLELIETFLATRVGAPRLIEAKALFHTLGCRGCHKIGGAGGDEGPDLARVGQKDPGQLDFRGVRGEHTLANWFSEHLRDPARVVPGSKMPRLGLDDEEIELVTFYLLSLRRTDAPEAFWPKDRIGVTRLGRREFGADGATLYSTFCAACHGASGQGRRFPGAPPMPAIGNADFLAVAPDAFLRSTIESGRPGRRMPAFGEASGGLRRDEVDAIVAHLRREAGVSEPETPHDTPRRVTADPARGKPLYERHCAGCHGPGGEGADAPALNHPVLQAAATDDYLVETIGRGRRGTPMHGFRQPSTMHPVLAPGDIEAIVAYLRTWEKSR